jgi:phosphatidylglycerol:prolipoprotein diacylglycerol transferase
MLLSTYAHNEIEHLSEVLFTIGNFEWRLYSFMIMTGIIVAVTLGIIEGKKLNITTDDILDGVLIIVPLSIIGARLWYVLFELNQYIDVFRSDGFVSGLINVIDITGGGLAIHGGFFVAFISAYIYCKKKGMQFFRVFDLMAPGFLLAQAFGRWGNFFNHEAHGGVVGGTLNGHAVLSLDAQRDFLTSTLHLPKFIADNMYIYDYTEIAGYVYYHPTFLYESVWNLIGFAIMLFIRRTKWVRQGELLSFYLIWYSIGRFFIEGMRTDSLYILETNIRTAQVISVVMIIGGIVLSVLIRKVFKQPTYHEALEEVKEQNALKLEENKL